MAAMSIAPRIARRPCVLLVDDTPANIDVLVGLLGADYDLKIATRGAKALQICESTDTIDLILLDVMMPGIDGYDVCKVLRAQPSTAQIPILFLTAKSEADDIVQGFAVGGNDYITKPFRPEELLVRVRTQLLLRAQQQSIEDKNLELKKLVRIVCHDVANHFNVLTLSLDFLEADPSANVRELLPLMTAAVKNGADLTRIVARLRRSDDTAIALSAVPVRDAVAESLLLLSGRLQAKQIEAVSDLSDVLVQAEPTVLINSVINNVMTNAIKFSNVGGRIDITAASEGDQVCLRIRDHGIGMSDAIRERLFDFGNGHSRHGTSGEEGTGFGMPLMHRFVQTFGGRVEVESRTIEESPLDHGTEFRVWLNRA